MIVKYNKLNKTYNSVITYIARYTELLIKF